MASTFKGDGWKASSVMVGSATNRAAITPFTGTINTSTTWAGTNKALPGSLLINLTNTKLYINTGTKASPTWTIVGTQS